MPRGRPRKIDPKDALKTAMMTFWEKGYERTSMADISEATGMAKPGLYASLGDKDEIFKKALALYNDEMGSPMAEELVSSSAPLKEALRASLSGMMHSLQGSGQPMGCFVLNSTFECSAGDPDIKERVCDLNISRRDAYLARLKRAKSEGELPEATDELALAIFFAGQSAAIGVMAQSGVELGDLEAMIEVSLSVLPG
ncbi:MAG: TetR/AcrR family transcriptional regulator [Roseibium sp.]